MSKALINLHNGIFMCAVPLVLDNDRKLNEAGQRKLIRYYLNAGVGGLAVGVHTTQFEIRNKDINLLEPVLRISMEEKIKFEKTTGKTIVMVAGACGVTEQAVGEAELAKKLLYDAVLLSPGGLAAYSEADLLNRTELVAKVIPVIGFYLQPSVGGRIFTADYWQKLCEIDNLVAIKAAPFNRYQTLDVVRAAAFSSRSNEIALYTGNDDNIVIDLLTDYCFKKDGREYHAHFCGGLLGHWAVWTNTAVKLFDAIKNEFGKKEISAELLTLAAEITDANAAFFDAANSFKGCITGIHQVLKMQGLMENINTLTKGEDLSDGQLEEIKRVYEMYPHLNDDSFVAEFLRDDKCHNKH